MEHVPEIVLPCDSVRLSSSRRLGWGALVIEHHLTQPAAFGESNFTSLMIELASGPAVAYGERHVGHGGFKHYVKAPGMLNVYTEGTRPALRPTSPHDLIFCALDSAFVEEAGREAGHRYDSRVRQAFGFRDPAMQQLVSMLEVEASQNNPSGLLFADHLIQALTLRLYTLQGQPERYELTKWDFSRRSLSRVIDLMMADPSADYRLSELAAESGYSRSHFIKAFRAATGRSPHEFLLKLRIDRAEQLMRDRSLRAADISELCGFRSQAQFSKVFRRIHGLSPTEYQYRRRT